MCQHGLNFHSNTKLKCDKGLWSSKSEMMIIDTKSHTKRREARICLECWMFLIFSKAIMIPQVPIAFEATWSLFPGFYKLKLKHKQKCRYFTTLMVVDFFIYINFRHTEKVNVIYRQTSQGSWLTGHLNTLLYWRKVLCCLWAMPFCSLLLLWGHFKLDRCFHIGHDHNQTHLCQRFFRS